MSVGLNNKLNFDPSRFQYSDIGYSKAELNPATKPTLFLNFLENPSVNSQGVTISCTRAGTNATYFDSQGVLQSAAANVVRFGYDSATKACLGMLIEQPTTNLMLWSRDLTQAGSWTLSNLTAALTATGVDGAANSASLLTATAGDGTALQAVTSASTARVFTFYVKRVTGTGTISITLDNGSTYTDVTSQLRTDIFVRVRATQTLANPTVGFKITTSGDAIAVDYGQLESATAESSAVLSASGQGVRNADNITIALSPWFVEATGSILTDAQAGNGVLATNTYVCCLDDTTANERQILFRSTARAPTFFVVDGGATVVTMNTGTWNDATVAKMSYAYTVNDFAGSFNGAAIQTDSAGGIPTPTILHVGQSQAATSQLNGYLRRLLYWNYRINNATLVSLAT